MKNALTAFIFFISIVSFSQSNKHTFYYFQNQEITKSDFETFNPNKIYVKTIENDTAIVELVNLRKTIGKLDSISFRQVKMLLSNIIGDEFNPHKNTLVHLYRENNNNIYTDSQYRKYWKHIKSHSKKYQAYLLTNNESHRVEDKNEHIFIDAYNVLDKLFFQASDAQLNHFFLKPNGEIYTYFGIDDILDILDWSVD